MTEGSSLAKVEGAGMFRIFNKAMEGGIYLL